MELSELALQKLLQLFPDLVSYIVSFKDISEESGKEDLGVRVGVFILRFGQEFYYVPVIAKNDTVMPLDSLFSAQNGTFQPLTRPILDQIIASSQVYLGRPTKIPQTVTQNPSVYNLVTPPRTGKFVYASSSRLTEFLATMPNMVKSAMLQKFSEDKEVYESLHRLFGLENLLGALKHTEPTVKVVPRPAVEVITHGTGLDNPTIKSILEKGYALKGQQTTNRVAVLGNDAASLGPLRPLSATDVGYDYTFVTRMGELKEGFALRKVRSGPQKPVLLFDRGNDQNTNSIFVLFRDGNYAFASSAVIRGEPAQSKDVIRDFFYDNEPGTPKDVAVYDRFALLSPDLELIGVYSASEVSESVNGVTIRASQKGTANYDPVTINAYRNCTTINVGDPSNIFVPVNTLVAFLNKDVSGSLENNVNAALARLELSTLTALGTAVTMGYDGVEFVYNGKPVGPEVKMVEILVGKEGLDPHLAENFIKQAKERRSIKVYMSKLANADFEPADIPTYGDAAPEQEDNFGAGKANNTLGGINPRFGQDLKSAVQTQDAQTVESVIISELLQATDMNALVQEYLPDLDTAIDKLGRTLFLARLNIDKLAGSQNANEITSFLANLRNVYRLLGDNTIKLTRMVTGPEQVSEEAATAR